MRVSTLADPQQPILATAAVLGRHQAQYRRDIPATPEGIAIAHHGDKCACHDRAKPRDRLQPPAVLILAHHLLQLPGIKLEVLIQLQQPLVALVQPTPKPVAQAVFRIL